MIDDGQLDEEATGSPRLTTLAFAQPAGGSTPFYVTDRTAPRRRRAADGVRLVAAIIVFGLLWWASSNQPPIDVRVLEALADQPGWVESLARFGFTTSTLVAFVVAVIAIALGRHRGVVRDLSIALFLTVFLGLVVPRVADGSWPHPAPEFLTDTPYPPFPTLRSAFCLTTALVLAPYVNAQVRRTMRWATVTALATPLLLSLTTVTTLLGAIALGVGVVTGVRLVFGSPEGLPSISRLSATLQSVGLPMDDVRYRVEQPGTVGLAVGDSPDLGTVDIKVYGMDAATQQRAERVWRAMWFRTAGPAPGAGRAEQAQHEALALLTARSHGVSAPEMIGAGLTPAGDALLVTTRSAGSTLAAVDSLTDHELRAAWRELDTLHRRARVTHGGLGPQTVRITADGIEFVDFVNASMFPTEQQRGTDVVAMLATLALETSPERAIDAAIEVLPADVLAASLPYVQNAVIEPTVRESLRHAEIKVKELHAQLAERLEIEPPPLASVRRVRWQDLLMVAAGIIAAISLISQVADVGLEALGDELEGAAIGWLVVTFLIRMGSFTTAYISMRALIGPTLPLLPTTLLQSAKGFVGLIVPSMVGRVGMDIRFLQNLGVPLVMATTQGPVISLIGFVAEVTLLLVCAWAIGQEVDSDGLFEFEGGGLILISAVVVIIGGIIVMSVSALRSKVLPAARDAVTSIKSIVSSPRTLAAIFCGEALDRLLGALALGATLAAFGTSIPFAALVFVSVGTGLLAGLAPVPGGIGVAEATMSGLLVSVGLPSEQAVAIAITYRMITAYLPPVLGFFSLRWLTREGFL
jgi:uncharacterized membrane protein YbhN (UPF0104 family)/tRNA A-37 threonylcarbamoyl transferase component Bud32